MTTIYGYAILAKALICNKGVEYHEDGKSTFTYWTGCDDNLKMNVISVFVCLLQLTSNNASVSLLKANDKIITSRG